MFARVERRATAISLCAISGRSFDTARPFWLHRRVKSLLLVVPLLACVACTTLENRRDLYRSPGEGYEPWYSHPPPTRLPSTSPATRGGTTTMTTTTITTGSVQSHGVITFPDEPALPEEGR